MSAHVHKLNKDKFIAEMVRRGWHLDGNGWIVPEGRRIHQRESDWLASILLAIECECPVEHQQERGDNGAAASIGNPTGENRPCRDPSARRRLTEKLERFMLHVQRHALKQMDARMGADIKSELDEIRTVAALRAAGVKTIGDR